MATAGQQLSHFPVRRHEEPVQCVRQIRPVEQECAPGREDVVHGVSVRTANGLDNRHPGRQFEKLAAAASGAYPAPPAIRIASPQVAGLSIFAPSGQYPRVSPGHEFTVTLRPKTTPVESGTIDSGICTSIAGSGTL